MLFSKGYELIHIGLYCLSAPLHCRYGIALPLQSSPLSPDSSESLESKIGGTSSMIAVQIAAKDKNFIFFQFVYYTCDIFRADFAIVESMTLIYWPLFTEYAFNPHDDNN